MASEIITINTDTPRGALLLSAVNQVAEARRRLISAKEYADKASLGNDWAGMAAAFGFASAADAQAAYNLLAGTVAALTAGDTDNLIDRIATS